LFGWVPVCLGIGIGVYFAIGEELDIIQSATLGLGCLCVLLLSRLGPAAISSLLIGLVLIGVGFSRAKTSTTIKEAPVLGLRYYGPVEGRIVNIDRSGSDAVRLTLDRVNLDWMSPAKTPARVRVSLHGDWPSAPIPPR
jgi:competence protein ComEC